jgi:serine phosphatase RsbU (regulator of sigma subunit)/Tfp pilus assembly protein PilF
MRTVLIIFLLSLSLCSGAQDVADSLLVLLEKASGKERVNLNNQLAREYAAYEPQKALKFAEEARKLAVRSDYKDEEYASLLNLALAWSGLKQNQTAESFYQQAVEGFESSGDAENHCRALSAYATFLTTEGDLERAAVLYQQAYEISKTLRNDLLQSEILVEQGYLNIKRGRISEAGTYFNQAINLLERRNNDLQLAKTYSGIAEYYSASGEYAEAVANFLRAGEIRQSTGDLRGRGIALYNAGNNYFWMNDYPGALESYQEALQIFREIGFTFGISASYDGLGVVYEMLNEFDRAFSHYKESIKIKLELSDSASLAETYNNVAVLLTRQASEYLLAAYGLQWEDTLRSAAAAPELNRFDSAYAYLEKAIPIHEKYRNLSTLASALSTRAKILTYRGDFERAVSEYSRILSINREFGNQKEEAVNLNSLAFCYLKMGNRAKAEELFRQSLELSEKTGNTEMKMYNFQSLAEVYENRGDYRVALGYYRLYAAEKDSFLNQSKMQAVKDAEIKYETRDKERQIDTLNRENELRAARFRMLVAGTAIITLLLLLAIRLYATTRAQNKKIGAQKSQIEHQKEEIDKSIQAGKDIQRAVFPQEEYVRKLLPSHFIFFRPVGEVSGDFYWITEANGRVFVYTADCTGHGVPGAFVSMMGFAIIREVITRTPDANAADILNEVRTEMITSMQQTGKIGEGKHGMDVSFYILDADKKSVEFAGANNPLFIARNEELLVFKGDSMPIGIHEKSGIPFQNHTIPLQKDDVLFNFSDGFQDQFGGPRGKKYMTSNFREFLRSVSSLPMEEMAERVHDEFYSWKGSQEQIDDVLIIGVRI